MKIFQHSKRVWAGAALLVMSAVASQGLEVKTLGGGPTPSSLGRAGSQNGNTLMQAKFSQPIGIAIKGDGSLVIADRNNRRLREVSFPGDDEFSLTTTFAPKVPLPVGVFVDQQGAVYSVNERDGTVRIYSASGVLLQTFGGLSKPTAVTVDGQTNIYVTELRGAVKKINALDFTITEIANGFHQPRGIALLNSQTLAISDTLGHAIYTVSLVDGEVKLLTGGNGAGFADGLPGVAQFNSPWGIARSPNGFLIVADRMNHRVRVVATNGFARTLYGGPKTQWLRPFAGWRDGDETTAQAREPVSVAVDSDGTLYVTEKYWNTIRQVSGANLTGSSTNSTGGTNSQVVVLPPAFGPKYGYHPMGINVNVTSTVPVYYTLDGSEPTTNSLQLDMNNFVGTIRYMQHDRDLRSLRLKAFDGTNASPTVGGGQASANEIGIPRDITAGSEATVVVPVVVNMRANSQIRSLQFRVEVTPLNGAPAIKPQLRATSMTSNDFIRVVTAAAPNTIATYSASPYSVTNSGVITRGLTVSALGTDANFLIDQFAVAAMLIVPISRNANEGDQYRIEVLFPSATSDANQQTVPLKPMPARTITVASRPYLVGDVSPGGWYNAGDFGDLQLGNDDVNAIFYAHHGIYLPYAGTDAFDAMDIYRSDRLGVPGGDRFIDSFDLSAALERALGRDPYNWLRYRTNGGVVGVTPTTLAPPAYASSAPAAVPAGPGTVWSRQATIGAVQTGYLIAGETYDIPIYAKVAPGCNVAGMSLRAAVTPNAGAPSVGRVSFLAELGRDNFMAKNGLAPNEMLCSWLLLPSPAFAPALSGSNIVGYLQVTIPHTATPGQSYTISFPRMSGGADMDTPYEFEGIPMTFKVAIYAAQTAETISDEWKTYFFGTNNVASASMLADPDGDGAPNWQEYFDGTNPVDATSLLHLDQVIVNTDSGTAVELSWLSSSLKVYVVERASSANGPWSTVASGIMGDGFMKQVYDSTPAAPFYRVRVQP
jgi:hypothetical protein